MYLHIGLKGNNMAVIDYQYQPVTHKQLEACVRWCQNQFQLRDWDIDFSTDHNPPKKFMGDDGIMSCYGKSYIIAERLRAIVWVNADFIKRDNSNPYSVTIHEMIHVMQFSRDDSDPPELATRILEPMLYRLYCYEHRLKIMKEALY